MNYLPYIKHSKWAFIEVYSLLAHIYVYKQEPHRPLLINLNLSQLNEIQ